MTATRDENILATYLNEIAKIPLLSHEEENRIALKAAAGDKKARDKLVSANLRFVVNVAKKYQGQGLPLEDLISEGNVGLLHAVKGYDANKGYHFISYAVWWIRQAILKAICEKSRMIRLPLNRVGELLQIEKARKNINVSGDEEIREIAALLGMEPRIVSELLNISREMVSLELPLGGDKDASSVGDFIEAKNYQTPFRAALESTMRDDIENVLGTLDGKEADVIRFRYGLGNYKSLSLKEIGDRWNLSKERVRQIEKKAIKSLQQPSRRAALEAYVA